MNGLDSSDLVDCEAYHDDGEDYSADDFCNVVGYLLIYVAITQQ